MGLNAAKSPILHGSSAMHVLYRIFVIASAVSIIPSLYILSRSDLGTFALVASTDCAPNLGFATVNEAPVTNLFHTQFLNRMSYTLQWVQRKEHLNLTVDVVRELVRKKLLNYNAKALYVGEGPAFVLLALQDLGFSNACGGNRHRFFSLARKRFVHELEYADNSFDFVLSRDAGKAPVPALLVLEIERLLTPGGIGAMLFGVSGC